jgi:hypothetical protein
MSICVTYVSHLFKNHLVNSNGYLSEGTVTELPYF